MLNGNILIVGGYGAVGRIIAVTLANKFPGQVVVAGRSYDKANALAQRSEGKVIPLQFDLTTAHEHPDLIDDVAVVVACLDVPDTRFVEQCLLRGIHYVDITAEDSILQQIEALDVVAKAGGSTAVLSVGLSPGLTNLLIRHIQTQFENLHQADIHIFLGLGEAHGAAPARWTLQNLNASFTVQENGKSRQVSSFGEHKIVRFSHGLGERQVYRFNFADQHVVTRTLNLASVSTWVTFDPALMTRLMAFMCQTGLSKLLRYQWIEAMTVKLSTMAQRGSDKFGVQVVGQGEINGRVQTKAVAITGSGQGRATGLVTARVVEQLYATNFPSGVFHSEQLFEPLPFIKPFAKNDIIYHELS
ncbi:MAG: saccharopine dehydrogenase NADP-binding domain-containing protein [Candidatus Promineifilaceae bacterium]